MSEALGSGFKNPAISRLGIKMERDHALIDARDKIWELGHQLELRLHEENTITRDEFGSIIKRIPNTTIIQNFYAYPVINNPTGEQIEKAGLREKTEVIVYTAMLDWMTAGYDMDRLNKINMIKMTVILHDQKFEIKDKNLHSDFSDTHLYVVLGLNKI